MYIKKPTAIPAKHAVQHFLFVQRFPTYKIHPIGRKPVGGAAPAKRIRMAYSNARLVPL